jgi:hypothetical protein
METEDSPNRKERTVLKRHQIGIVEGRLGQTIGLEEMTSRGQGRRYSVICNSTQNRLIKIARRYLEVLFQELPAYYGRIQEIVAGTVDVKDRQLTRIKQTKSQLQEYIQKTMPLDLT